MGRSPDVSRCFGTRGEEEGEDGVQWSPRTVKHQEEWVGLAGSGLGTRRGERRVGPDHTCLISAVTLREEGSQSGLLGAGASGSWGPSLSVALHSPHQPYGPQCWPWEWDTKANPQAEDRGHRPDERPALLQWLS